VLEKPFAGPPGISQDRLEILKAAFNKAYNDPELLKQAKRAQRPINLMSPKKCKAYVNGLSELSPDVVAAVKGVFGKN